MAEQKISSTNMGERTNTLTDFKIGSTEPDGIQETQFTSYTNTNFTTQWDYYINTTDIQEVIDAKGRWVIGKGFKADETTTMLLDTIIGYGKDTFNTIIENMTVTAEIAEDAYAEIIRDEEENLINLKVLNTGRMTIVAGKNGLIDHYEYAKAGKNKGFTPYQPNEILHFSRNRRGDEIHGRSMIMVLKKLINAKQQAIDDQMKVNHMFVCPQWKHKLKTDDPTEIAAYKTKMDAVTGTGQNIYEPMDVAEAEIMSVPPNATLNQMAWIQYLDSAFYKAAGVPQFIVGGGSGFTEASEKISYLAWQQTIEKYQLFIEEQVLIQLNLVIELEFPASLENELLSDKAKDGAQNIDQSELNAKSKNT